MNKLNWEFLGTMTVNIALWSFVVYCVFIR